MTPEQTQVLRWLRRHGFTVTSFNTTTGECCLDLSALVASTPKGRTETER